MTTAITVSDKTKQLLDLIRGERSYNKLVFELASSEIQRLSQPKPSEA